MCLGVVEGEHRVGGGERLAVRPLDALTQVVGDALQVGADFVGGCEGREVVVRVPDIVDPQRLIGEILHIGVRTGEVVGVVVRYMRVGMNRGDANDHLGLGGGREGSAGESRRGKKGQ